MEITLLIIALMVVTLGAEYRFFQLLAQNAEYKRQQKAKKINLVVEYKGKGWNSSEND